MIRETNLQHIAYILYKYKSTLFWKKYFENSYFEQTYVMSKVRDIDLFKFWIVNNAL